MQLKKYQQKAIDRLKEYLKELEKVGTKYSFMGITDKPYKSDFFGDIPFVCMKLPTGAGKTFVGCHSVKEIMSSFLKHKMERGIVLWFTPSEAIKSQTLRKFKDRHDMHRKVFDEAFENRVRIFSNEEALSIRKEDVKNNLCVIVASLEAFRKEKHLRNKYKVYKENGNLMSHFENVEDDKLLEPDEHGTIINSLANVVIMNNPLIVIDEGHKTKTKLSIEFLKDLNPSFVIEYTATPRAESNILVDIHSSELKEEQMVKLPIVLESKTEWQVTIMNGVNKRIELENLAKKNKQEYIRPIALLQAESDRKDKNCITVDKIKEFLINERKIPEEEIAIKTSNKNELDGVNLFSQKCKIKYIITVNALAEGWDCSFAYVLISVANIGSKIAVEQIIGRILRMPYAKKKETEELNRSYVFASARDFNESANQIIKGLEEHGYSRSDLVNSADKKTYYEFEVSRKIKEDFSAPVIALNKEILSFVDLIGEDFKLSEQNAEFKFELYYDKEGKVLIDITDEDKWSKEIHSISNQQILDFGKWNNKFSKEELVQWLDKRLRFIFLDKPDKVAFIEKAVEHQLKNHTLLELSINRFAFLDRLRERIGEILEEYSKKRFEEFSKKGNITLVRESPFSKKIMIGQKIEQKFSKNYYESVGGLNKEELMFIGKLDLLPNIKFWIRNREREDPFYLQGWKRNKFYPDFIAVTNKGKILALEWKGEDRMTNEDTEYKEWLGKFWEGLNKNLKFYLVGTKNINEVLKEIAEL